MPHGHRRLQDCLNEIDDPRYAGWGTLLYYQERLVIADCARLTSQDTCEDIALGAHECINWIKRFLLLNDDLRSAADFPPITGARLEVVRNPFPLLGQPDLAPIRPAGQIAADGHTLCRSTDGVPEPAHILDIFSTGLGSVAAIWVGQALPSTILVQLRKLPADRQSARLSDNIVFFLNT